MNDKGNDPRQPPQKQGRQPVAPGPVWTPLIPASFSAEEVAGFGSSTLLKRPAQPSELGPAYVFLAGEEASFITGQTLHVNGGAYIGA